MAALGDGADVPDHWLGGIQVGGCDQQEPPAIVFADNARDHLLVEVAGDEVIQRGGVR